MDNQPSNTYLFHGNDLYPYYVQVESPVQKLELLNENELIILAGESLFIFPISNYLPTSILESHHSERNKCIYELRDKRDQYHLCSHPFVGGCWRDVVVSHDGRSILAGGGEGVIVEIPTMGRVPITNYSHSSSELCERLGDISSVSFVPHSNEINEGNHFISCTTDDGGFYVFKITTKQHQSSSSLSLDCPFHLIIHKKFDTVLFVLTINLNWLVCLIYTFFKNSHSTPTHTFFPTKMNQLLCSFWGGNLGL